MSSAVPPPASAAANSARDGEERLGLINGEPTVEFKAGEKVGNGLRISLSFISFVVLLVTILFLGEFENGFVGRYKQPFKPILPKENAA